MLQVIIDKEYQYLRLKSTNYKYHQSVLNAIRRVSSTMLDIFCFDEYLDAEDYDLLKQMGVSHLPNGHQRHTTIVDTTRFPIPVISHAISMTAINNSEETIPLLEENKNRKVFFAVCGDNEEVSKRLTTPYVNKQVHPVHLYSHDLVPFVFTRESEMDEWNYNDNATDEVKKQLKNIFKLNEHLVTIEYNKKLNVIVKPMLCRGFDHPRAETCTVRFRHHVNPDIIKSGLTLIDDKFQVRRKVEGEYSAKELFSLDFNQPIQGETNKYYYHDKVGTSFGVELVLVDNGKMSPFDTLQKSTDYLIDKLQLFHQDLMINQGAEVIKREIDNDNELSLVIPPNVEKDIENFNNSEYHMLIDDGLLQMLVVMLIKIVDMAIDSTHASWWQHVNINYNRPHRLVSQVTVKVKLPEEQEFKDSLNTVLSQWVTSGETQVLRLVHAAINLCVTDLKQIQVELNKQS